MLVKFRMYSGDASAALLQSAAVMSLCALLAARRISLNILFSYPYILYSQAFPGFGWNRGNTGKRPQTTVCTAVHTRSAAAVVPWMSMKNGVNRAE